MGFLRGLGAEMATLAASPEDLRDLVGPGHVVLQVPRKIPQEVPHVRLEVVGVWERDGPVSSAPHPVEVRNRAPVDLVHERLVPCVKEKHHVLGGPGTILY